MKRTNFYLALGVIPLLAGCGGPEPRDLAVFVFAGLPGLFVLAVLMTSLGVARYRRAVKIKLSFYFKKQLLFFLLACAVFLIAYLYKSGTFGFPRDAYGYLPEPFGGSKITEFLLTGLSGALILAPFIFIVTNVAIKILLLTNRLDQHPWIPFGVCVFFTVSFFEAFVFNSFSLGGETVLEGLVTLMLIPAGGIAILFRAMWAIPVVYAFLVFLLLFTDRFFYPKKKRSVV